jgi:serine O-acetyltransferase
MTRNPIGVYRAAHWLWLHHVPVLPRVLEALLFLGFGARIPCEAEIGRGSILGHGGNGIVVHALAHVGERVVIAQQVTIGGTGRRSGVPRIEDDVYLGAGARVLGPIVVGRGCIVGANAVVRDSLPPGAVVASPHAVVLRVDADFAMRSALDDSARLTDGDSRTS